MTKMTGAEMKFIRHQLGLSTTELGRSLGYAGSDVTASGTIRKYESDARPIPPWIARLIRMFSVSGVPAGWEVQGSAGELETADARLAHAVKTLRLLASNGFDVRAIFDVAFESAKPEKTKDDEYPFTLELYRNSLKKTLGMTPQNPLPD